MLRGDLDGEDLDRVRRGARADDDARQGGRLGPRQLDLPAHVRPCVLRDRDDVGRRAPGWTSPGSGSRRLRASPRQADLIILSGRVSIKMAPVIRRLYDQMLEPKWAISMGACCSSMGVFNNYALVPSDKFMPIDVHVPGCPPRPEALAHGILRLRDKIRGATPTRAGASATTRSRHRGAARRRGRPGERQPRSTFSSPGTPPVPDATGLELTAQELRETDPESILDTEFHAQPRDA